MRASLGRGNGTERGAGRRLHHARMLSLRRPNGQPSGPLRHDPAVDFTLSPEDADALREVARLSPLEARAYLQDRPELTRRMASWPPEIRLEVCRILWQSFPPEKRDRTLSRRHPGSNLLDLLDAEQP